MIILKVIKKPGFTFSLENTILEETPGGIKLILQDFLRLQKDLLYGGTSSTTTDYIKATI